MLQISRDDVPSEYLVKYENPFLKLNVLTYMSKMGGLPNVPPEGLEPISSQIAIINALNNPKYRFVCAAVSRRQGKTYIANIVGQLVALVPGSNVLIMSPNYSLSQISFELQRKFISHFQLPVKKDNAKDKLIELDNGSTIRMGSVNQVDSCVGRSYDFIIFDEAALTEGMDAFSQSLRPTLDKDSAKALFISTPRGRNNWFSVLFSRGFSSAYEQWASIKATWHENPRTSQEDIDEAKRTMSEAYFRQEYMADFTVFEGQIWPYTEECLIPVLPNLDDCDIFAGIDVGFRDPTAFVVCAYSPKTDTYYIIDEYMNTAQSTETHAKEIQLLIDKWDIDHIFIDAAAAQTRFDLAQQFDIGTTNAKKSVKDGVAQVSSLLENDRLYVLDTLREVHYAFDQYQWDPNPNLINEKPLHNRACHMADALRYALYSFTENAGVG